MDQTWLNEAQSKEYRHGWVRAQIEIDLPLQIRALRKQRGLTQPQLAELTGMKQSRFSILERPGAASFTLETLRRLAEGFDVALIVRFAPFSELLRLSERFNPDAFNVPSFEEELERSAFVEAETGKEMKSHRLVEANDKSWTHFTKAEPLSISKNCETPTMQSRLSGIALEMRQRPPKQTLTESTIEQGLTGNHWSGGRVA